MAIIAGKFIGDPNHNEIKWLKESDGDIRTFSSKQEAKAFIKRTEGTKDFEDFTFQRCYVA
jgi:hypothetical protein